MVSDPPAHAPEPGRRLSLLAGFASLLIAPFLFIGGPDWASGPLLRSAWNLGHLVLFALLTLAIGPWRWLRGWRLWVSVTAVLLGLGLVIELIQSSHGRDLDGHDLLRNLIGSWLVLAGRPLLYREAPATPGERLMAGIVALLLCLELGATGVVAARQWQVHQQLPLLYDFGRDNPAPFWGGNPVLSRQHTVEHPYSLRLDLGTALYSGVTLHNLPSDWRGYDRLAITLFNPDPESLTMTLRINDVAHDRGTNAYGDRFNTQLTLAPGLNTFELTLQEVASAPRQRRMDMDRIRRLGLFAVQLPAPRSVFLLDLRLIRTPGQAATDSR
ncbi:MAG: succinyl-CoA synthetase subunit beta [Pseudomonadota bacterium]|uniref:succinyl-CoA synthetase subunit beta n=1 Tax=Marinobacter sp. TaxID=50741 RepID=UPI002E84EF2D|nr:succinyl-CoA synthetase subunit beta [Pseudomonadota bacterium]